jgi:uncharacterized protein (DUF4415 family)
MSKSQYKTKPKYGNDIMDGETLKSMVMNPPAEMPKKQYSMPVQQPVVEIEPNKKVNRIKLEADLNDLLFSAGGQAPGYRRQLNKILDQYL